jgi:hypothetical protein
MMRIGLSPTESGALVTLSDQDGSALFTAHIQCVCDSLRGSVEIGLVDDRPTPVVAEMPVERVSPHGVGRSVVDGSKSGPKGVTSAEVEEILSLRALGHTHQQIADRVRISEAGVSYHCRKHEAIEEAYRSMIRWAVQPLSPLGSTILQMVNDHEKGASVTDISKQYDLGERAVRRWLDRWALLRKRAGKIAATEVFQKLESLQQENRACRTTVEPEVVLPDLGHQRTTMAFDMH